MKVMFVIKNLNGAKGGAEKILCQLASFLSDSLKFEVRIFTFDSQIVHAHYPISPGVIVTGIGNERSLMKTSIKDMVSRILKLRSEVKTSKPDVVVPFMISSIVITAIAALGLGVPVLGSEHIVRSHYKKKPLELLLFHMGVYLSRKTTVISQSILDSYPLLSNFLTVIPNPVDPARFTLMPNRVETFSIINVGRLEHQKNQETLIRSMEIVLKKYPKLKLKIFGEGSQFDLLKELISSLHLENNVFLMGTSSNLPEQFLDCDIFVFPSRYESFGLALAEALSMGVPSIAFKGVEGVDGLIEHQKNGILLESNMDDPQGIATAIVELYQNSPMRQSMSKSAHESMLKRDSNEFYVSWEKLIRETTCVE